MRRHGSPSIVSASCALALAGANLIGGQARGATPPPASTPSDACASTHGKLKGDLESSCRELAFGGRQRTYRLYVPAKVNGPSAVVFVIHGGSGTSSGMEPLTRQGFNRIADRDGILVIYPDGVDRQWNDGRPLSTTSARDNIDDVGYLRALLEDTARDHAIDRTRVYATGISNGGFMSMRLACEAADTFVGVVAVAATLSDALGPHCAPSRPVSVGIIDGTDDPLVPWAGGEIKVLGMSRGLVWSAQKTFDRWMELNGCTKASDGPRIDADPKDETALVVHTASACRDNVGVRLYEIQGGGHTWPKGVPYLGTWAVGRVSQELDATEEIWKFFRSSIRTPSPPRYAFAACRPGRTSPSCWRERTATACRSPSPVRSEG
jgi:polyhydroxybutyrate depolymerase